MQAVQFVLPFLTSCHTAKLQSAPLSKILSPIAKFTYLEFSLSSILMIFSYLVVKSAVTLNIAHMSKFPGCEPVFIQRNWTSLASAGSRSSPQMLTCSTTEEDDTLWVSTLYPLILSSPLLAQFGSLSGQRQVNLRGIQGPYTPDMLVRMANSIASSSPSGPPHSPGMDGLITSPYDTSLVKKKKTIILL